MSEFSGLLRENSINHVHSRLKDLSERLSIALKSDKFNKNGAVSASR